MRAIGLVLLAQAWIGMAAVLRGAEVVTTTSKTTEATISSDLTTEWMFIGPMTTNCLLVRPHHLFEVSYDAVGNFTECACKDKKQVVWEKAHVNLSYYKAKRDPATNRTFWKLHLNDMELHPEGAIIGTGLRTSSRGFVDQLRTMWPKFDGAQFSIVERGPVRDFNATDNFVITYYYGPDQIAEPYKQHLSPSYISYHTALYRIPHTAPHMQNHLSRDVTSVTVYTAPGNWYYDHPPEGVKQFVTLSMYLVYDRTRLCGYQPDDSD